MSFKTLTLNKAKHAKPETIRKAWPRIRVVHRKGERFYQVDARKKGSLGKQEHYSERAAAETRANQLAAQFEQSGSEGLTLTAFQRVMVLQGEEMLKPFGKTILQASEFYRDHLLAEQLKASTATVRHLAKAWYDDKASGKTKKLRKDSLRGLHQMKDTLITEFGEQRIASITTNDIKKYLNRLGDVSLRYKFNVRSLMSQFFNWCINQNELKENPTAQIEIIVEQKDVEIWTPEQALAAIRLSITEYPDLLLFHAISLFGGLRPTECRLLKWSEVHADDKLITVLAETSKVKETRNVPIEGNLIEWLKVFTPSKAKGLVVRDTNFDNRIKPFRAKLGYRNNGENKDQPIYPPDVLRHCYGSYWLAKHANRAQLAEHMGNSVEIIGKHYRRVVGKAAVAAFWNITPEMVAEGAERTVHDSPASSAAA